MLNRPWGMLLAAVALAACHTTPAALIVTRFSVTSSAASVLAGDVVTLTVTALNKAGQPVPSYVGVVGWQSTDGAALLPGSYPFTAADKGTHAFPVTLRTVGAQTVTVTEAAKHGSGVSPNIDVVAMTYTDPPTATGKIRLVRNAASTATTTVLDLVAAVDLAGYAVGFNLPVDTTRVSAGSDLLTPGTGLQLGSPPLAATAAIGSVESINGVLTSGVSQKAAGAGAVPTDSAVAAGQVFYTLKLSAGASHSAGVVFDGATPGAQFHAALRDRLGEDVVKSAEFAIGKLELK
jgi:hypothetical protein